MLVKRAKLEYWAFYHPHQEDHLVKFNIFNERIINDIAKEVRAGRISNRKDLYEWLRSEFMYRYWSKCEWEFVVSQWTGNEFEQKVDVFNQIEPNIDLITDLVIDKMRLEVK